MIQYVTKAGVCLDVGRVDRRLLDDLPLDFERPNPPTREVEIWDGTTEKIPVTNDPDYLDALSEYYLLISSGQFHIIETAVTVTSPETAHIPADSYEDELLRQVGLQSEMDGLGRILSDREDATAVIELIFYNSTVTYQGIEEAAKKFNVTWESLPILSYKIKPGFPVDATQYYSDRKAAYHFGFKWNEFCNLQGWEQSEYAALYAIDNALEHMVNKKR